MTTLLTASFNWDCVQDGSLEAPLVDEVLEVEEETLEALPFLVLLLLLFLSLLLLFLVSVLSDVVEIGGDFCVGEKHNLKM